MNLSADAQSLCIRFDLPAAMTHRLAGEPEANADGGLRARHTVERIIQGWFYQCGVDAFVHEGRGTLAAGLIFIKTDHPAIALERLHRLLWRFPMFCASGISPLASAAVDLLPFVHLAWMDETLLWRMFHPLTTRPFWTLMAKPGDVDRILERGRAIKA